MVGKKWIGVECLVTYKLPRAPVQLIVAGLGNQVGNRAGAGRVANPPQVVNLPHIQIDPLPAHQFNGGPGGRRCLVATDRHANRDDRRHQDRGDQPVLKRLWAPRCGEQTQGHPWFFGD